MVQAAVYVRQGRSEVPMNPFSEPKVPLSQARFAIKSWHFPSPLRLDFACFTRLASDMLSAYQIPLPRQGSGGLTAGAELQFRPPAAYQCPLTAILVGAGTELISPGSGSNSTGWGESHAQDQLLALQKLPGIPLQRSPSSSGSPWSHLRSVNAKQAAGQNHAARCFFFITRSLHSNGISFQGNSHIRMKLLSRVPLWGP